MEMKMLMMKMDTGRDNQIRGTVKVEKLKEGSQKNESKKKPKRTFKENV